MKLLSNLLILVFLVSLTGFGEELCFERSQSLEDVGTQVSVSQCDTKVQSAHASIKSSSEDKDSGANHCHANHCCHTTVLVSEKTVSVPQISTDWIIQDEFSSSLNPAPLLRPPRV